MEESKITLTEEQKQAIVDEVNSTPDTEEEGNTTLFRMADMDELMPYIKDLTPLELFDKSVIINKTSLANLSGVMMNMSKKNIIKLFFATLNLPENNGVIKFGGTKGDKELAEYAFTNAQLARNALVHVLGTTSIAQAKLVKKREEEMNISKENNEETTETKED